MERGLENHAEVLPPRCDKSREPANICLKSRGKRRRGAITHNGVRSTQYFRTAYGTGRIARSVSPCGDCEIAR